MLTFRSFYQCSVEGGQREYAESKMTALLPQDCHACSVCFTSLNLLQLGESFHLGKRSPLPVRSPCHLLPHLRKAAPDRLAYRQRRVVGQSTCRQW